MLQPENNYGWSLVIVGSRYFQQRPRRFTVASFNFPRIQQA